GPGADLLRFKPPQPQGSPRPPGEDGDVVRHVAEGDVGPLVPSHRLDHERPDQPVDLPLEPLVLPLPVDPAHRFHLLIESSVAHPTTHPAVSGDAVEAGWASLLGNRSAQEEQDDQDDDEQDIEELLKLHPLSWGHGSSGLPTRRTYGSGLPTIGGRNP